MKIGIDIDGVIFDFERQMNVYAELYDLLVLEKNGVINKNKFSYLDKYDWSLEEKRKFTDEYLIKGTLNCSFVPGVKESLELLTKENEVFIITARGLINKETKKYVSKRLMELDIKFDNINFEVKDKLEKCKSLNIELMIEDNPEICEILSKNGIKCLYLRDKNSPKLEENEYLIEVNNWGEILRYIINNKNSKKECINILRR